MFSIDLVSDVSATYAFNNPDVVFKGGSQL
jgi:hypothetical protein